MQHCVYEETKDIICSKNNCIVIVIYGVLYKQDFEVWWNKEFCVFFQIVIGLKEILSPLIQDISTGFLGESKENNHNINLVWFATIMLPRSRELFKAAEYVNCQI